MSIMRDNEDDKITIDQSMIESFSFRIANEINLEKWFDKEGLPKYLKKPLYGTHIFEEGEFKVELVDSDPIKEIFTAAIEAFNKDTWMPVELELFEINIVDLGPLNELYEKTIASI